MASLLQHPTNSTNTSGSTVAVTVAALTAGSLVVMMCGCGNSRVVSSISDGTNTYQVLTGSPKTSAGNRTSEIWYAVNVAAGATTVTVTFSGANSTDRRIAEVQEWSGMDTSATPYDGNGVGGGSFASNVDTGPSITTTNANDVIVAVCRTSGTVTTENDATFTLDDVAGGGTGMSHVIVSATGTYTPKWNDSIGSDVASSVGAFQQAGGATVPSISSWVQPLSQPIMGTDIVSN